MVVFSEANTIDSKLHPAVVPVRQRHVNWLPDRHEQILNRVQQGDVDMIFVGDSITHIWDREDAGKEIWDKYYAPRNAVNMGFGCDRTQHVLWRIDNGNFDNIKPKLIVLTIGVNNFRNNPAQEISQGISAIVNKLKKKVPNSKILLLGPLPAGANKDDPLRLSYNQVHELISSLGKQKNVIYQNIGREGFLQDY